MLSGSSQKKENQVSLCIYNFLMEAKIISWFWTAGMEDKENTPVHVSHPNT